MNSMWSIRLVRALFFALFVFTGITISLGFQQPAWMGALTGAAIMGLLLALDILFTRFSLRDFSHATFGLAIGLFCAWLVTRIGVFQLGYFQSMADGEAVRNVVEILIYTSLAFFGVTFALRSDRDQFAFLIPYVRFRRDGSEGEPLLLDTNVIIDGRIAAVVQTGFLSGALVVPRFVLDELQRLTESGDAQKVIRGRRGLEVMEKMRTLSDLRLSIHEDPPGTLRDGAISVDTRLVSLARELNARLLTNDENLAKVARLRGIIVLSFNDLSLALQPQLSPGDELSLALTKPGKDKHQAVGYLADGTMIVVNQAAAFLGQTVEISISGALPTSAGRLIFAELKK
ncbi:PIN/TRAM domain-containing protein [Prosthecobacter dejongeii]|nr:PIN domain-containing protein [Prosthecobacter dejongeii]